MPVSKKPRRPKSTTKAAAKTASAKLPDRHALESFLSALGGDSRADNAIEQAQDIMYDAWDRTDRRGRIALAKKALKVSPLCADAYVLLAEEEARSPQEALELYRKGVEAGEVALGPEGFEEFAGHFWGFLETRPYMRAREGLAAALRATGDVDAALGQYRAMLELNPNDNQGVRYVLTALLLERGDIEALKVLLKQYEDDGSPHWLYTRALIAFRENGPDDPEAEKLAKEALDSNSHVPGVLSGAKRPKPSVSGYITMGGEDEAAEYVLESGPVWRTTPGAIEWLTRVTAGMASKPKRTRKG